MEGGAESRGVSQLRNILSLGTGSCFLACSDVFFLGGPFRACGTLEGFPHGGFGRREVSACSG